MLAKTVTATGASALADIAAPGAEAIGTGLFWSVTALDAAIWVAFGPAAVAAANVGFLIPPGQSREFGAQGGHRCAVKLA